jgi:hypothetical protein
MIEFFKIPLDKLVSEDVRSSSEDDLGCIWPALDETSVSVKESSSVFRDGTVQHF